MAPVVFVADPSFKGGNDVFVDIGDKRLGVVCCRQFFGGVEGGETLHIGGTFAVTNILWDGINFDRSIPVCRP